MTAVAMGRPEASVLLGQLRAGVSRVAEALFQLDSDPELPLLRSASLRGRTAQVAQEITSRLERLWLHYPVLKEAVDALDSAVAAGDDVAIARLTAPGA